MIRSPIIGQPTDDFGNIELQNFVTFMRSKPEKLFVSILACTDDEDSVDYLDGMMAAKYPNLDVSEDYRSEAKEVKATGGKLTFGDYVCKVLLGPIDPSFGDAGLGLIGSEPKKEPKKGGCCTIA